MSPHVSDTTTSTIGTVTSSRRTMNRSISVRGDRGQRVLAPLRAVVLDVDVFPGVENDGVRVHALDVGLLQPVAARREQRNHRLCVKHVRLGLGEELEASLWILLAIRLFQHRDVFLVPPARAVLSCWR